MRGAAVVVSAALVATPHAVAARPQAVPVSEDNIPPLDMDAEIARMAEALVLPADVVAQHMALRGDIAALRMRLISNPHFAGLWVEQGDSLMIAVAFAGVDPEAELQVAAAAFPEPELLSPRAAEWSLEQLEVTSIQLGQVRETRQMRGLHGFDISIDEPGNRVTVEVTSAEAGASVVADAVTASDTAEARGGDQSRDQPLMDQVRIVVVPALAGPTTCISACEPIVAGLSAVSASQPTHRCSIGFTATRAGVNGVLTAAHCADDLTLNGEDIGALGASQYAGAADVQWHALTEWWHDWRAIGIAAPDETMRAVRSVGSADEDYVGMPVCAAGATSGFSCGTITSLAFAPNYINGGPFSADFRTATYASAGGDSGGPVFLGEEALGVHSGRRTSDGSNNAIYTHVANATSALSAAVNIK